LNLTSNNDLPNYRSMT